MNGTTHEIQSAGRVSVNALHLLKRVVGATGKQRLLWQDRWRCWCPSQHEEPQMNELLGAGLVEVAWEEHPGATYYRPTQAAGELFGVTIPPMTKENK